MPHRPVKSILGLTGAALWLVSGCTATTAPSFEPLISGEHATRDHAGHHQAGVEHLKAARYGLAVFELRKALRENARSIETLNALGVAYDHLGQFDVARNYYDRALALDANAPQTLNNLGRSAAKQGNIAAAVTWLERAQRLAPDSHEVAENLAEARNQAAVASAANVPPSAAVLGAARPADAWVERTDRLHQTLVTAAPSEVLQTLASLDIRPEVINVAGEPDLSLRNRPRLGDERRAARNDAGDEGRRHASEHPATERAVVLLREGHENATPASAAVQFEVSNGAGRRGMAARVRDHLARGGVRAARLTNADHFGHTASAIFYRPGFEDSAAALYQSLPVQVDLIQDDRQRSDVRLRLGGDLLDLDLQLLKKG